MLRKLTALAATLAFALTTLTPVAADARDRRHDGYWGDRHDGYYDNRRRHRRDNDDDAVAAGVVGLVLGVALGAALSQPRQAPRAQCSDDYQRCAPPPQYYNQGYDQGGYYEDERSAYEQDYGAAPEQRYYEDQRPQRTCTERQWDRYANRYLMVDVPC